MHLDHLQTHTTHRWLVNLKNGRTRGVSVLTPGFQIVDATVTYEVRS